MPDMLKLLNKNLIQIHPGQPSDRSIFSGNWKIEAALPFYKRAAELAPYHLDVLNKYATALSIAGKC